METLKYQRDKADKRPIEEQLQLLFEYVEKRGFEVSGASYDDNYLILYGESK